MGDVHGCMRHVRRCVPELRLGAERESDYPGGCVRARVPAASRAADLCHYAAAGKNPKGTWDHQKGAQPDVKLPDGTVAATTVLVDPPQSRTQGERPPWPLSRQLTAGPGHPHIALCCA